MYTTEEMINQVIFNLNGLTISGVANMELIINSINMLSSVKEGIRKHEEEHKAQMKKMMDRIEEIGASKGLQVITADVCQNQ